MAAADGPGRPKSHKQAFVFEFPDDLLRGMCLCLCVLCVWFGGVVCVCVRACALMCGGVIRIIMWHCSYARLRKSHAVIFGIGHVYTTVCKRYYIGMNCWSV